MLKMVWPEEKPALLNMNGILIPTQLNLFFSNKKASLKKRSHSIKIYHFQITVKGT